MKTTKYGIIHAYAQCNICEWDAAIDIDSKNRMNKLRYQIKKQEKEIGECYYCSFPLRNCTCSHDD